MKKASRIVLPIVLALSIVLCLAWYLMIYDREFTRDMLLGSARYFEGKGQHETASWFYSLAYKQAGNNDDIAIELAEQHKAAGNYTKAEYVLYNAISDGGGAELYIALSKIYVEQDKLLDAVKLMDAVCREDSTVNVAVKDQLIALRPAAPTATPAPGLYTQYISVSLLHDGGTLYVNTAGEYPSTSKDKHSDSITLSAGENTIYALVVSDDGLVSPLSIFGYTVGGVIEEISFADSAIEAAVRELLSIPNGAVLTSDLWNITEFTVPEGALSYADLRHMTFLKSLCIKGGVTNQLNYLSSLTKLEKLEITNVSVSSNELSIISALPALKSLTLSNCGLYTTESLERATGLTYLDLSKNTIYDISALAYISGLKELHLQNNALKDLTALSSLTALTILDVSYNSISDITPVCSIARLTDLYADGNTLTELNALGLLTNLKNLSLAYNQLTSISMLESCTSLEKLNISNNALVDISILGNINTITDLDFSHNKVTKLPLWSKDAALIRIDGSHNELRSMENLRGLKKLNAVYLDYNKYISLVNAMADCPVIVVVSVYGTSVKDVSILEAQDVIVYYDPT